MSGNENFTITSNHSAGSSIDLDDLGPANRPCCGGGCSRNGGCTCADCTGRMSIPIANENTSNYAGQGGHDQRPVAAHANTISSALNSLTTQASYQDPDAVGSNSYEAPLPSASPLTRQNIEQLNTQSGGRYSHAEWLARHYEDVDQNPAVWFNTPVDGDVFDVAGTIEGEGMEESLHSLHSLHVGHESPAQSISMLSQYTSSFSRTSGSPTTFLPDMRRSLVHRPLLLVPECHRMAVDHMHNHHFHPRRSG